MKSELIRVWVTSQELYVDYTTQTVTKSWAGMLVRLMKHINANEAAQKYL